MPDNALIDSLETLRAAYAERQKLAGALTTQIKAAHSAAAKAAKTLNDLAGVYPDSPQSYQSSLQFIVDADLKRGVIDPLTPDLKADTKRFTNAAGALKALVAALRSDPYDVAALNKALDAVQKLNLPDAGFAPLLNEAQRELERAQSRLSELFGQDLREALAARGMTVSGRGPFEIGRFDLAADTIKRSARLNYGKHPVIQKLSLSVPAILKALDRASALIMERKEDGEGWMAQFYEAWERARKMSGASDRRVNVVDCYFQLTLLRQKKGFRAAPSKGEFVDYTRAQFAYDLYEFTQNQKRTAKGLRAYVHAAIYAQSSNPEKSLWIVEGAGPHDGRYIGDVVFDEDE